MDLSGSEILVPDNSKGQAKSPLVEAINVGLAIRSMRQRSVEGKGSLAALLKASLGSSLKSIRKSILTDLNFSLYPGDRVGLIGANGAGKSTLLMLLNGVLRNTEGQLKINGTAHAIMNVRVGMKFRASGLENIFLNGYRLGKEPHEIEPLINDIIEFSELGEQINEPVSTYSAGMQLRLAFAIATSAKSDVLIMDEWVGAGDQAFRKKARERIMGQITNSSALIIASHNEQLIRGLCNKIILLEKGRLIHFGDVDDGFRIFNKEPQ